MSPLSRPVSLVAERAVRYLKERGQPVDSRRLARDLLATRAPDEATARSVLEAAFAGDPRLVYAKRGWSLSRSAPRRLLSPSHPGVAEADRTLLFLLGEPQRLRQPFNLAGVSAIRLRGEEVLAACGGDTVSGPAGNRLRRAILETLDGAVPVETLRSFGTNR